MAETTCGKCKYPNPEGRNTCARCGTPLPSPRPQAPSPAGPAAKAAQPNPAKAPQEQLTFRPGQVFANRYTVLSMIGRGGMGCIYRVHDNALKEEVALKTLLPQFVRDRMVVERFFNEARIARGLSHPNIVRVHDIGMSGSIIYISMELIRGQSLRGMLDALPTGQRLPIALALRVIDELCAALEFAHRHTVHRDIKPENIMLGEDGTVKLMDFGISKLMATTRLTGTSMVMGTPFYMSPEQVRNSADVDARSDIYSVGVVFYEVLTGNVPTGVPRPASQLSHEAPPGLDPIVAKCVDPDPAKRYQSVSELRRAIRPLRELVEGRPLPADLVAPTVNAPEPPSASSGRGRRIAGIVLLLLVLAAASAGLYRVRAMEAKEQSAAEIPATAPNAAAPPTGRSAEEPFRAAEALLERARAQAAEVVASRESLSLHLSDADARWEEARRAHGRHDPAAPRLALHALQCYAALAAWPSSDMVLVPPGDVTISDAQATGVVSLPAFFIDRTEVTNQDYARFCAQANWPMPYDLMAAPNSPVTNVTFYDAQAYAAWAGKTLPTEAQWARAAYGGPTASSRYPWGEDWLDGNASSGGATDVPQSPAAVGSFMKDATWCGCVDMAGNVSEWTRSLWMPLPYSAGDGREDAERFYFGADIVIRGGNFQDTQRIQLSERFACKYEADPVALGLGPTGLRTPGFPTLGFRCTLAVPATLEDIQALVGR